MKFFVLTEKEFDHNKVMEIARERSIMYSNAFGGGEFCQSEMHGTFDDYCIIKNNIEAGHINAHIEEGIDL